MADDINVLPGTGGVPVATDELTGGRHAQLFKLLVGTDGQGTMVSDADPLPTISRPALVTAPRLSSAAINVAASGDNLLLAGTSAQTIRLFQMFLQVAAAVNIKFKDGTGTDFHPALTLSAGGTWFLDFSGEPWFTTAAANGLYLNLSAAVQVSGRFYFTKS